MDISDLMTKDIVTVTREDSVSKAKQLLEKGKFHNLLVVERNKLFGVVSDRDIFIALSPNLGTPQETDKDKATLNRKVHLIMDREPVTLPPNAGVYDAIDMFIENTITCIPIVDEEEGPVGILSWRDVFKMLSAQHKKKLMKKSG